MAEAARIPYRTTGATFLLPLSHVLGIPLDQVNFVACQLFALLAAFCFRLYLSPSHTSSGVRHAFSTICGVYFAIFCFGWYSIHIFVLVIISYGIMNMTSIHNIHRCSFVVAMGYLTLCHISRIYIFNYGILTTDFSGPLMIITQKITTLAFQVHDGICKKAEELTVEQNQLAVRRKERQNELTKRCLHFGSLISGLDTEEELCELPRTKPTLLEYLSYHLNFLSIIAGPFSNYKDYIAFIEGRHIQMKLLDVCWKQKGYARLPDPSPMGAVLHKLCVTLVSLLLFLTLTKRFPVTSIVDNEFINKTSFWSRIGLLYVVVQASKPKYYFAWTLADLINNAAGYGFSGVDEKGNFHWGLLSNLNIRNIEMGTSFKMYLENWNIQTSAWLRCVCYERAPWYPTALTFLLSAIWHGLYPGYYFTFITGILMTLAARAVRCNCRHFFLSSKPLKMGYDVATWIVTHLAVSYTVAPFLLLAVEPTMKLYKSLYFHMHILCVLVLLVLPNRSQKHTKSHHPSFYNRHDSEGSRKQK